ncbi:MAG: O-antigen ligase family protein [Candidatus Marinimicrobia bacterium]|nr:O-antigen ligase family protein [Candidatus Neomarinimicrobiota bacterium]
MKTNWESRAEKYLRGLLLAFAFTLPITLSLAEGFLFLSVIPGLYLLFRYPARRPGWRDPLTIMTLVYLLFVLISFTWSSRPLSSLRKIHRFGFFFLLPAWHLAWPQGQARSGLRRGVIALLLGIALLGVYDLIRIPWTLLRLPADLPRADRLQAWFDAGNMRDPQIYLVGLCLLLPLGSAPLGARWRAWRWPARVLYAAGLLLHFKRGAWAATLLALGAQWAMRRRWRALAGLLILVIAVLLLPPVRARLAQIPQEFNPRTGGRASIWLEAVPALRRDYPHGIGWHALKHEDLAQRSRWLQDLNHAHNNLLQEWVELGWPGAVIWLVWMLAALGRALRLSRAGDPATSAYGVALFGALLGLLLNGCVESNFRDSEILMTFALLFAWLLMAGRMPAETPPAE